MSLIVKTPIQMRFTDMDAFEHISNVAQQIYYDQGKTHLFGELWRLTEAIERVPAVIVSLQTDFIEQIRFGEEVYVETSIASIGTKSFTLRQRIMRGETVCSRSHSTMVCFDKRRGNAVAVPEQWRKYVTKVSPR